jgi:succinate CoA transferase
VNNRAFVNLTPDEAASLIHHGQLIAFGGFTTAAAPQSIAAAIGAKATQERSAGREFAIGNISAATGAMDAVLADATAFRTPYQCDPKLRDRINTGQCDFVDMHLSQLTQAVRYGFLGRLDWAVVQAADLTPDGKLLLTSAVGGAPTYCAKAEKVLVELNRFHPPSLLGMHDLYEPVDPPSRRELAIYSVSDRIGSRVIEIDPAKIVGVVESEHPDEGASFNDPDPIVRRIGQNVAEFLAGEVAARRLPATFLPVQSGVGDIGNAVLGAMGSHPDMQPFQMYTEIVQDAVVELMEKGRVQFASCSSLTLSPSKLRQVYDELPFFRKRILMRPQEITNHPEVVRRLGVISINTALEVDIFGNVNSTHVLGQQMVNGIGGSGDFTRNAYLSMFTCRSAVKQGRISTIVPMITHVDHSEHSVNIIVTEWGVADLRASSPHKRAVRLIDRCAHPDYRDELHAYLRQAGRGHTAHSFSSAFSFHERFKRTGDMRRETQSDL